MKQPFKLNEHDYRYLFENSSDAMWVHDLDGHFIDANRAFEKLSGGTLEDWSGIKISEHIAEDSLLLAREVKRKLLAGEPFEQPYEQKFTTKDGRLRLYQVSTSPVIIDGEVRGFQHVGRDVTEEKSAEEMLQKIIDGSPIAIFVINRDHTVTHWNTAIEVLTGIRKASIIGTKHHWKAFYDRKRPTMADLVIDDTPIDKINRKYPGKCRKSRLMNDSLEAEAFFSKTGDNGKWLLFNACPIRNEMGETVSAIETIQEISEQKELQEKLRDYGQLILRAQEDERKRIARELHDDTASSMLLLIQRIDAIESCDSLEITDRLKRKLEDLREHSVSVLDSVRRCAQELRPRILDDLGFLPSIEWIADDLEKTLAIRADVIVSGKECQLAPDFQLLLFRIVQEAMSNIRRHAGANRAEIAISYTDESIHITISDNGRGFSVPDRIEDLASRGNLGIMGMSERAQLMHGILEVKSKPDKGTKILISIPCSREKQTFTA